MILLSYPFFLLTQGYQNTLILSDTGGAHDIHKNSAMGEFRDEKAWALLYRSVGPEAFCKLILDHILLVGLPNNMFYQLSGYPINKLDGLSKSSASKSQRKKDTFRIMDIDKCMLQPSSRLSRRQRKRKAELHVNSRKKKKPRRSEPSIDRHLCYSTLSTQEPSLSLPKSHIFSGEYREKRYLIHRFLSKMFPKEFNSSKKKKKFLRRRLLLNTIAGKIYKMHNKSNMVHRLNSICPNKGMGQDIKSISQSYGQVEFFLKEQLKSSFPLEFWGSQHNFGVICRAISHFVKRNKIEKLAIQEVLHQFKIKDCKWLSPTPGQILPMVLTDLEKRKDILIQALRWVFDHYISVLIRSLFYVTECSGFQLFYFRKDSWYQITRPFITSTISNYEPICADKIKFLKLSPNSIRIVPKSNGFRVITSLKDTSKTFSTNKILKPILQILNFEKEQQPEIVGSSVQAHEIFERLKLFKNRIEPLKNEKLYFVKVDIASCFDSIDPDILMDYLKEILTSKRYVHRYADICKFLPDGTHSKIITHITGNTNQIKSLEDHTKTLRNNGAIVVGRDRGYSRKLADIIKLLEEVVKQNIVQIGTSLYQRKRGLPQGLCLSSLLCDFFLGAFENKHLPFLKENSKGLLLRYVDDFLYISPHKYYSQKFLETMTLELPMYGIDVNKDKCLSNLECDIEEFPWLGYLFNTKNLDVHIDLSSSVFKDLQSTVSIRYEKHPGKSLLSGQIRSIRHKIQSMLVDPKFNSKSSVVRNLNDTFYITARRLEVQITKLSGSACGAFNAKFILDIILQVGNYVKEITPSALNKKDILASYFLIYQIVFQKKEVYKELVHHLKNTLQLVLSNKDIS